MQDQLDNQTGQLPSVPGNGVAPNATLGLAVGTGQPGGIIQSAVGVLMNTAQSPRQMSSDFAKLKEEYLTKTYGVTIE